jgi:large subunit ribosomal protein L29
MKPSDIRNHNQLELQNMVKEQEALLANLKFNHKISPIENPARIALIRKDIARMKTILTERTSD